MYILMKCQYTPCQKIIYVQTFVQNGASQQASDPFIMLPWRDIDVSHPSIPSQIAEDWLEAQKSLQAGAPKAAAVMFRRVLYGILLEKSCTLQPLHKGLAELIKAQRLPAIFDEWLPAIKDDGHDAAHPDRALQVDPQNIVETREYTSELLRFLYIEPYEFQQRKNRITPSPKTP